jgi:PAS domain S-box-containing protein
MGSEASPYSVLVVEDNPDLVMGLQDFLQHDGYSVTVAATVAGATELVRAHRFNAIILDLGLPDGDGLEVLKEAQRLDPSLPVVIVTAHISADRTVGALAEGAFAYLTKPYDREELRHILRRAIGVKELTVKAERTEYLLNVSEERFRSLVESASDAIVVADHRGCIVSWNRSASRLFGYADEEAIGKPLTILMPARYRHTHEQGLARIEATGTGCIMGAVLELHGLKKDGTEFPIELTLATWTSRAGNFYSGIIRDISVRKKTEDALRRSEQLLRDVADNTTAVIYVKSSDGRFLFTNRRFEQLFHLTPDQIIGRTNHDIFPQEFADAFRANDLQVLKQNCTLEYEELAPHEDGLHTYLSIKFPLCDPTGKPYATCGISTDITERKQTEEALRQSEERFRTMFTQAPIGMALIDSLTGHIYETNAKFAQTAGRTTEEMASLDWMSITHPDDVQADLNNMARLNAKEIAGFQMEKRYVRPDGTIAWINLTVAPIQVKEHAGPRHLAMIEDITERKRIEQTLRTHEEQLRLALTSIEMGTWNWDLRTGQVHWSSQVDRFLGLADRGSPHTQDEWLALVYREDRESLARVMRQAMDPPDSNVAFEHRVLKQNGSFQWCIWAGEIIRDRDGKALQILGTVRATDHSV